MASLFHQTEIFALHLFASIDILKNILIIYFGNKLGFNMPCPPLYLGDPIQWNGRMHGIL